MTVDPLRGMFLAEVQAECAGMLARADAEADAIRTAAVAEGEALVESARAEGLAAAGVDGTHTTGAAHRHARALLLQAERELYDDLRARSLDAALRLVDGPGYDALLERLAATARRQLGPTAEIQRDPRGGLVANRGGRHVDYSLAAIVDRCLDALGPEVERLWR